VNFQVQHLSDEAVAAFADGMLAVPAHNRALRHVDQCVECALAIDEQRAAVSALRAAPAPALPAGLLERLRAVPVTTPLTPSTMALAPDGSAVFPAYGTVTAMPSGARFSRRVEPLGEVSARRHEFHLPVPVPHLGRRTQQLAFVAVAAAMFTVGVAASASANTASPSPAARLAPGSANSVEQAGFSTSRGDTQLVGTLTSKRH
jgi:hypothetical protein